MKIIAHRANLNGPSREENSPVQIIRALMLGYDVEVDVWGYGNELWLGHDNPEYPASIAFLAARADSLWLHCKNKRATELMYAPAFNYFMHEDEPYVTTSKGYTWCHPTSIVLAGSVAVLPEQSEIGFSGAYGVCTDYAERYACTT